VKLSSDPASFLIYWRKLKYEDHMFPRLLHTYTQFPARIIHSNAHSEMPCASHALKIRGSGKLYFDKGAALD
jgi:hypothetical protein